MSEIKKIATHRKIGVLVHFTRTENLEGILTHGLLPRTAFDRNGLNPLLTDQMRLDSCLDASSLSIGFPNYKMFYACRMNTPGAKWAVIVYRPSILWEKRCAFCTENAAKASVAAIRIDDRMTPQAFEALFSEVEGKPTRNALRLDAGSPTNPQAEVLVFEAIEPSYIIGIGFDEQPLVDEYKTRFPLVAMRRHSGLFGPRVDYIHWKK